MDKLILRLGMLALFGGLFYYLYVNGYMTTSVKSAVGYIGRFNPKAQTSGADFASCNGTVSRYIRARESREYRFSLDLRLRKGSIVVEITDHRKNILAVLDADNPTAAVYAEAKERYLIRVRYLHASGSYSLNWE